MERNKMRNSRRAMFNSTNSRQKFGHLLHSDPNISLTTNNLHDEDHVQIRHSTASAISPHGTTTNHNDHSCSSVETSPYNMSPWNNDNSHTSNNNSPYIKSPWSRTSSSVVAPLQDNNHAASNGLIGSLVREEGHIYSLAATGDLLYTGSDSKNIRVWKNQKEYSGFKSNSGLIKAIIISGEKIFTGHQDGKIRVWKVSTKNPKVHKKVGTLPTLKAYIKSSMKPSNYVEVRRHRNALWIRHFDAISCLSLNEEEGILYSGSWDKTLKVWRISDSKCLESINAHDDAVNSVVNGFDGMVFTGSADGTVKVWRRELQGKEGKGVKHTFLQTLLKQDCAVTALAINGSSSVIYCGSSDGVVSFWERREKHMLSDVGVLKGHKLAVLCLSTGGSNLVFSGSADQTICVWKRENGIHTCLNVLTGHSGPVKCLAVEKDRESTVQDRSWIVYSGSLDKSVKVWRVSEKSPVFPHGGNVPTQQPFLEGFAPSDQGLAFRKASFNRR